jgi:phage gp29-like protein
MFFKKIMNGASQGIRRWLPGRWIQETTHDRTRYAQTGGYTPERMAALMRQALTGDISELCIASREIRSRNWDILHALQTRTAALSGCGWSVEPGDDSPAAKEAAEALERELRDAGGNGDGTFADLVGWLQLAVVDPFAAAEIVWSSTGGIEGFRSIGAWHFTLRDGFTPRLVTEDAPSGMDLPPDKVIIHRRGGESDPAAGGLIRCLAWLHVFQNYPVKDLLSFVERYGMPFVVAKVDNGTFEQDRWTLRNLIRSFGPNGGGIINRNTELELLQAANTGGDVYFRLLEYTGQAITKVLLGQLASSADAAGMSNGDAQSSVRQDLLDSDARALESTLRSQLIAPWMRFRFASPVPAPRIHFSTEQPEDIQALAQTLSTLSAAGLEAADIDEVSARIGVKLQRKPVQEVPSGFGMGPTTPPVTENADSIDTLNLKQKYDAMGVAIRAGLLTATPEIEAQTRTELGLPEMTPEVRKAWEATGGIRQPITLKSAEADAMNDALDIDDNDEENDSGIPLGAEQRGTTLPDALAVWLGLVADAAAELDSDALSDADFVAKLKACADMEFGDSGAFEKLETADMEAAYGTADQTRKR